MVKGIGRRDGAFKRQKLLIVKWEKLYGGELGIIQGYPGDDDEAINAWQLFKAAFIIVIENEQGDLVVVDIVLQCYYIECAEDEVGVLQVDIEALFFIDLFQVCQYHGALARAAHAIKIDMSLFRQLEFSRNVFFAAVVL